MRALKGSAWAFGGVLSVALSALSPAPAAAQEVVDVELVLAVDVSLSMSFEELKIPVDTRDSNAGVVGNSRIIKLRSFGGAPMSRLLNCGSGMTGPNADSWRIYITVLAFVEGKGSDKSVLRVGFIAGAQDIQGASKDPVACGTTGAFEMMFADRVKKRLALT